VAEAAPSPSRVERTGRVIPDDVWGILCVFAEARGESYEGQIAVANVIRNRTQRHFFSRGTVTSTVCYPKQFSWLNDSDSQRARVLSASWDDPAMRTAAKAWFESADRRLVGDAVLYHTVARPSYAEDWPPYWAKAAGVELVTTIGNHAFYRDADR
jgi:spore germination cell wall hydrolase CwlJ-like protein